jgi:hypothetical protein
MAKLVLNVKNYESETRVRDMRRQLAKILSALNGDRKVTFSLTATLEDYDAKP